MCQHFFKFYIIIFDEIRFLWVDTFELSNVCSGDVDESYMNMLSGVMDGGDAGSGDGAGDADGAVGQDYLRDVSYWKGKNPFG